MTEREAHISVLSQQTIWAISEAGSNCRRFYNLLKLQRDRFVQINRRLYHIWHMLTFLNFGSPRTSTYDKISGSYP